MAGSGNPAWKKGVSGNPAGKSKGTPNKFNHKVWEDMIYVHRKLGGRKGMLEFIEKSEDARLAFYKEFWKRAPQQLDIGGDFNITFQWAGEGGNGADDNGPL